MTPKDTRDLQDVVAGTGKHAPGPGLPWGGVAKGSRKGEFKRLTRRLLKDVAKRVGLEPSQYDLRFNAAGPAVSGECTLHADTVYVQCSDSDFGILIRSCNGRKDYRGGRNTWYPWSQIADLERFAQHVGAVGGLK